MFEDIVGISAWRIPNYSLIIDKLKLDKETYNLLKAAFQGGFTHANPFYSGKTITQEVRSYDFNSSYPAVMVSEQFPMGPPKKRKIKRKYDFNRYLKTYCCLIDVTFYEIESTFLNEHYISRDKAREIKNPTVDNGRIVSADMIRTVITEIDFEIIQKTYSFKSISINNFITFERKYLPKDFILCILSLYNDKTKLKGDSEKEMEYALSKSMCNSSFGMSVTDIVRDKIEYDNGWMKQSADIDAEIKKYNKDKRRFLYYPWGVWITAYARRNLWEGIFEYKDDYLYSDTDSVKVINPLNHIDFISKYNINLINKLKKAMKYHGLKLKMCCPKTIDKKVKILGLWENDGNYTKFKTLGAKRYMYKSLKPDKNGNTFFITIAGVSKEIGRDYLEKTYKDPFEVFEFGLTIPKEGTGKLTHSYIDEDKNFDIIDYMGNVQNVSPRSGIHMEGCEFHIKENGDYITFLMNLVEGYEEE